MQGGGTMKIRFVLVALMTSNLLASCASNYGEIERIRAFYKLPVMEQMATFRQHSITEQLEIFFYGNQFRHPPAQGLALCYAMSGPSGAALLKARLSKPGADLETRDIALLLEQMQRYGTYDVRGDTIMINRLSTRIASMHDDGWQKTTTNFMRDILTVTPRSMPRSNPCTK
jgi:hypothetical protein